MANFDQSARPGNGAEVDSQEIAVDVSDWSESSKKALAETVDGLAQLEQCLGDATKTAAALLRFRRSMTTLLRDLRSRDIIEPANLNE